MNKIKCYINYNYIDILKDNKYFHIVSKNINKGNKELKKYKEENMTDNTVYYKYIIGIIFIILLFALLIYYKVYYSESEDISPKVQGKNVGNNLK